MNEEQRLKLQAYLDGELPEGEARDVAAWIDRDSRATALLTELKTVRQTLGALEPQAALPETREFYWSKIARAIQAADRTATPSPAPAFRWQQILWPVGAIAVCFIVIALQNPFASPQEVAMTTPAPDADTPIVEAIQPNSEATTYRDDSDGTTLVWFSMNENSKPASATF
jgi:anti-sigma factor RsiW